MLKLTFKTKPWKHQLVALKFLMKKNYGALYTDMGTGKTKIMIDLIINLNFSYTLVVCPKKAMRVWEKQVKIHSDGLETILIDNKSFKDITSKTFKNKKLCLVINYDLAWRQSYKKFFLKNPPDAIICDESHRIKSPGSKCSRFLHLLGKKVKYKYLVTGTPMAQSPLDIYGQYRFLDQTIFGTNFYKFKHEYSNQVQLPGLHGVTVLDKKNPYKNLDKLYEKMFECAFMAESEVELPDTQDILLEYDLPSKVEKYYKQLLKDKCIEFEKLGGFTEAAMAVIMILRLQQLVSGYLPDEDTGKDIIIDRSRIETFKDLLLDMKPDEPVVVFCKYRKDIKNIRRAVKELDRKSSEVSGKRNTLQNWEEGKTQVLVVQIQSGCESIDLTRSRYCIYYSLGWSLGQYQQSRKRIHRPGQTRSVIYYTLIAKLKKGKSIDERLYYSLQNKENLIDSIMRGEIE